MMVPNQAAYEITWALTRLNKTESPGGRSRESVHFKSWVILIQSQISEPPVQLINQEVKEEVPFSKDFR